jgi:5-keto-L-gluconate epimerase
MKLSVAVADAEALPSAFVVFRGFEQSARTAAQLGYDGIELALKRASEVDRSSLAGLLKKNGLEVSCISTGQVYADLGFSFTDREPERRAVLMGIFRELIDLAADFGRLVNFGRVRGRLGDDAAGAKGRFIEAARELAGYAAARGVGLLLEPVNRYELDFVNSVAEGSGLMAEIGAPNFKLMPDVFHMNIEDASIAGELERNIARIGYLHLADSNRLAPGWGHTDFAAIFTALRRAGYDGWLSVEILPKPEPREAAGQAIRYLKPYLQGAKP